MTTDTDAGIPDVGELTPEQIQVLCFTAFRTNKPEDRQAYFNAASAYFHNRHVRAMDREEREAAEVIALRKRVEAAEAAHSLLDWMSCHHLPLELFREEETQLWVVVDTSEGHVIGSAESCLEALSIAHRETER